jgi:hypothetical protein
MVFEEGGIMDFATGCLRIAASSWNLNVSYPIILANRNNEVEFVELPEEVKDVRQLHTFLEKYAEDDTLDALAVVSEVWFDVVTFGKPLQLSRKHPDAQDGLAVTLICRNKSYVTVAQIKDGEIGPFSFWRILSGGRFSGIRLGSKLDKAV